MKREDDCRSCAGRGSNFGQFCPDCNGTGMAATKRRAGCILITVNAVATIAFFWWLFT